MSDEKKPEPYVGKWSGVLRKGDDPNTIVGYIMDEWGWRIEITGTANKETRQYEIVGTLGNPPDALRVAAIDGERLL